MRIVIAIAENTVTTDQIGQVYWAQLNNMHGRKTHYKNNYSSGDADPNKSAISHSQQASSSTVQGAAGVATSGCAGRLSQAGCQQADEESKLSTSMQGMEVNFVGNSGQVASTEHLNQLQPRTSQHS